MGFSVGMSHISLSSQPEPGRETLVHTWLQVRDDGMALFGFSSTEERDLFERLIAVSGVGPKVALAALSAFTPQELARAIAEQDVARVQKVPGIGKKTASRIILELKGALDDIPLPATAGGEEAASAHASPAFDTARNALLGMGFTATEADLALAGAPQSGTDAALLQYALKRLGGN